jgi:hypothetical protein
MCDGITKIIDHRKDYLTQEQMETQEIFMLPSHSHPLAGWSALKKVCSEITLEHPEAVTSTNVRKYVATASQVSQYFLYHDLSRI